MSTIGYGPLARIDGPPPSPPAYGLLQAAAAPAAGVRIVPDADAGGTERWLNGVEVYPYPTDVASTFDTCAPVTGGEQKGFGTAPSLWQYGAFTVYLAETCSAMGVWNQDQFKARAAAVLAAVEGAAVEHEFMSGAKMLLNPHLADGNGAFPNGNFSTSPVNGLALLENEIAKSGRAGVIHVSPGLAAVLDSGGALNTNTPGVIRTVNGTAVIAGYGYVPNEEPAGHPAAAGTQEWAYATGPVDVRRSDVFTIPDQVSQALDRGAGGAATGGRTNTITYRVERHYLVDWDTAVQAAVLVDRCQTTCA